MNYLQSFLDAQAGKKTETPLTRVLTELTEPPSEGEKTGDPPYQGTDRTDETPVLTPPDIPEAWPGEHAALARVNERIGYPPASAAALARMYLEARAAPKPEPESYDQVLRDWLGDLLEDGSLLKHLGTWSEARARSLLERDELDIEPARALIHETMALSWPARYKAAGVHHPILNPRR